MNRFKRTTKIRKKGKKGCRHCYHQPEHPKGCGICTFTDARSTRREMKISPVKHKRNRKEKFVNTMRYYS